MKEKVLLPSQNPFRAARRAGVPIVAIESADPAATIVQCAKALNGSHEFTPLIRWDIVRGVCPLNKPGSAVLVHLDESGMPYSDPIGCLAEFVKVATSNTGATSLRHTPETECDKPEDKRRSYGTILYMIHANRWIEDTSAMQAIWNARDSFEPLGCMLVLIGPMVKLPAELKNDVVLISEPLPGKEELSTILDHIAEETSLTEKKIGDREVVIDTMSGTSAFGARQILSMSVTKDGIDADQLWERKRKMIEQTKGLAVWNGGANFDDIGGLDNLKSDLRDIMTSGNTPVRAIGFIDEIEKGLGADTGALDGGVSKDQTAVVLKVMQDYEIPGIILVGHAGTGKSEIAKSAGKLAKCPVISIDTGAMKDSLVGSSEASIRLAMEVFKAVSQGKGFFIATCNKITSLPPELRRRFTLGTYFVDLPTAEERALIWPIWIAKYGLKDQPLPDCEGWTGAEIRACCDRAYRTGRTLKQAALNIVPVIKSAPEAVAALRQLANNRFINAAKPGVYKYNDQAVPQQQSGRKIEL